MTKHRLMLSAVAAILLAQPLHARAQTTISNQDKSSIETSTDGNITINQGAGVGVKSAGGAAVTLNSNNFVSNLGGISNTDSSGAIGVQIDTTAGSIVAPSPGFSNEGSISVDGDGNSKVGILVTGGNTYFGAITLNSLVEATTTGTASSQVVQPSVLNVEGDDSAAFYLVQGTTIDGDVNFAGTIKGSGSTKNPNNQGDTLVVLAGVTNGNVVFDNTTGLVNVGNLTEGVDAIGGIYPCVSNASVGYTCSTASSASGLGALVNMGDILVVGTQSPSSKYTNSESDSAIVIGSNVAGGFLNDGPGTSDSLTGAAEISANGTPDNSTFIIDPDRSITDTQTTILGPINIGPVSAAIDPVDGGKGYSFINHGSILAQPIDGQVNASTILITGASTANYTCLGTGTLSNCVGGMLNTGTIQAAASSNPHVNTGNSITAGPVVTANALSVGAYAAIPQLVIMAETEGSNTYTPGTIVATVSGEGQGDATAIAIAQNAILPSITIGQRASVTASVTTTTLSPTSQIANSNTPFSLISEAIVDASSTLATINNAGTISAVTSELTPLPNAVAFTTQRAIDLSSSNTPNVNINNSGIILGDILFGAAGGDDILNVGNTGSSSGAINPNTGVLNTPNNYAVIAERIDSQFPGQAPATETSTINFGSGANQTLHVGSFGDVDSVILANPGQLAVEVDTNGILFIGNTSGTGSLNASTFNVYGGTLGLTISQNTTATTPVVKATGAAYIDPSATIGLQFGTFISSGTTAASVNNPTAQNIVLINAPLITDMGINNENTILSQQIPFLFQATSTPLSPTGSPGNENLVLTLTPRAPGAKNADGTPGLGLSGDALAEFPYSAAALANDPLLGAAIAPSLTVYNTANTPTSGINIPASQQQAQQVFSKFGPDVSGGAKQVAIMITDQASGPVAAHQRLLHSFSDQPGDLTLWGEEFTGMINNKGLVDADGSLTNYKDHGFGFSLGIDSGSPQTGWYGGAFTYYSGDVSETLPRDSLTHTQWYMLTGYTDWRGPHLFLDTQASVAYGGMLGNRDLVIGDQDRDAIGRRAALMGALGANLGAVFHFGGLQMLPHLSLDGLTMREERYTETGGGDGFDLAVAPYYANSLRGAIGSDFKTDLDIWDVTFTPEARIGYRYDLDNSPVKLKAGFASTGGLSTVGNTLTFVGPDPDTRNIVGGLSLGASTDTWQLGVNYDWLRGNNGSTTQVGTVTLLGRM